jgi:ribosomal protein S18 acetylase RimI-like enzyme
MQGFDLRPYERRFAVAVKECALKSWQFTYHNIFSPSQIVEYVNRFYSDENNMQAEELMQMHLIQYTLALSESEELVGFQTASIKALHAELTRLYVLPEKIGSGIGSALPADAENFFIRNGFRSYQLKVHRENVLGQKFYERKGFTFLGEDDHEHFILKKILA